MRSESRVAMRFAVILLCISPIVSSAEPGTEGSRRAASPALRNWIPALASHPPAAEGPVMATALPSAASHFIALTPCRVVDTRNADGAYGGPILTGGVPRVFEIPAGPCPGIPVAAAYSLNVTVTGSAPGASQFLTVYPAGTPRPLIASMVFDGGQTLSNAALVPADGTGSIEVYVSASSHVILDINGYVKDGVVTSVSTGAGLSGGGMGAITLSVANGGITSAHLGSNSVGSSEIANGAIQSSDLASGAVQSSAIAIGAVRANHLGTITLRTAFVSVSGGTPGDGIYDTEDVSVSCQSGEFALSGGFYWTSNADDLELPIISAYFVTPNTWRVRGGNDLGTDMTLFAQIVCLGP